MFFVFNGSSFLKTGLTSATLNSAKKLDVTKVLLNSSAKVPEQLSLLVLKMFGGIFPKVLAFFVLRFLESFSISGKETSVGNRTFTEYCRTI